MRSLAIHGDTINVYEYADIETYARIIHAADYPLKKHRKTEYYNIPASFDIETTSTYIDGQKTAYMYIWQLDIDGYIIIGRTWPEFVGTLEYIQQALDLTREKQLIIYVHNLAYEFQFMRKYLLWEDIFAVDERRPVMAQCSLGIKFKCSYILTNLSLAGVSKNLQKYPVAKLTGDLDYSLIRTSETQMTDAELSYCVNDVRVVVSLIREKIENDGDITKIPLTQTGYVRNYTRKHCLYKYDRNYQHKRTDSTGYKYYALMKKLTLSGAGEYAMLKRAFQGGFTHASVYNVGNIHKNVSSFDITSSYPTVMIADYYPMSRSFSVQVDTVEQFYMLLNKYCCLFDIRFYGLRPKTITSENYLSDSKCRGIKGGVYNNGRIAYADEVTTTMTEIDFDIMTSVYTWDSFAVGGNFLCYRRGYLPKPFIECILHFYGQKTTLKGVEGKEVEYMNGKGMLNSLYGMIVTDICRPEYAYMDEWETIPGNTAELIDQYNKSKNRFMFYPWGIWVTAHARHNIFELINECGADYIYSDTDSVKMLNVDQHREFITRYNLAVERKIYRCLDYYRIPREMAAPCDIHGKKHVLGVFENETENGAYLQFKTLGAKRYMYQTSDNKYHITVAGLNKHIALDYLTNLYKNDILKMFNDNLYIPPAYTGKQTHTYIDAPAAGYITDYQGHTAVYDALTSVHLEGAEYSLSIAKQFANYIKGFREVWTRQYD